MTLITRFNNLYNIKRTFKLKNNIDLRNIINHDQLVNYLLNQEVYDIDKFIRGRPL